MPGARCTKAGGGGGDGRVTGCGSIHGKGRGVEDAGKGGDKDAGEEEREERGLSENKWENGDALAFNGLRNWTQRQRKLTEGQRVTREYDMRKRRSYDICIGQ